jgi:pimeloyl-ACP methyl ester carboxylesterase
VPFRAPSTRVERERAVVPLLYSDHTPRERIEEDIELRMNCTWCREGFVRQFAAILLWSAYRRLPHLRKPVLVVHGEQDRLVPIHNGRVLARRIPGARFESVPKAGHVLTTDQPEECSRVMTRFLREHESQT